LPERDLDVGKGAVIPDEHGTDAAPHQSDGNAAPDSAHRLVDGVTRRRRRGQDALGLGEQRLPRLTQLDAPGGPDEQGRTQVALERPDRCGPRRLRDVTTQRGPREVPLLGHGHELLQLLEVH
jgi:hypothetical protein